MGRFGQRGKSPSARRPVTIDHVAVDEFPEKPPDEDSLEGSLRKTSLSSRLSSSIAGVVAKADRNGTYHKDKDNRETDPKELQALEAPEDRIVEVDTSSFADRKLFLTWMMASTFTNMMLLGLEADLKCFHNCGPNDSAMWDSVGSVFSVLAIIEFLVALASHGPTDTFLLPKVFAQGSVYTHKKQKPLISHPMWVWLKRFSWQMCGRPISMCFPGRPVNWFRVFDLLLVVLRPIDTWLVPDHNNGQSLGLKYFAALRVAHVPRSIRRMYSITAFRELWLILENVMDTMKTVMFVIFILCMVMWTFAVAITIMAGERHPNNEFDFTMSDLSKNEFWGTVPKSFFSLFQVVTRDNYGDMTRPFLDSIGPFAGLFIAFFLVLTWLAALSTILGAIVESTLQSAMLNREKQEKARARLDNIIMNSVIEVFTGADKDDNGFLTKEELDDALNQESVKNRLKVVSVKPLDLRLLFSILDEHGSGEVNLHTFFRSCKRLRGDATAKDLNQLQVDVDRYGQWAEMADKKVSVVNDMISDLLDVMDMIDRDVVQDPTQDHKDPVLMSRRVRQFRPKSDMLRSRKGRVEPAAERKPPSADSTKKNPRQQQQQQQQQLQQLQQQQFARDKRPSARGLMVRAARARRPEPRVGQKRKAAQLALGEQAAWPHNNGAAPLPPPIPEHLRHLEDGDYEDEEEGGDPRLQAGIVAKPVRKYGAHDIVKAMVENSNVSNGVLIPFQ